MFINFSKVFDTVRHYTLADKLAAMDILDNIFNWIVNYFSQRGYVTGYHGLMSAFAAINASIKQGPPPYVVVGSDLHPRNAVNILLKYADKIHT